MRGTILVTGATGNIGGMIASVLLAQGYPVRIAARDAAKAESLVQAGGTLAAFDYTKPDTFAPALEGIDKLFLLVLSLAAPPEQVMVIIDEAKRAGVRHIVALSGMSAGYDEQLPSYKVERYIEQSGIPYTFLRPNWFMQNFHTMQRDSIREHGRIAQPAGDAKVSFIDTRDIAAVAVATLTADYTSDTDHYGQAYSLTGGQSLDHHEVAAILSRMLDKTITYVALTEDEMRERMSARGGSGRGASLMLHLYHGMREGQAAAVSPDVAQVLGRDPISFEQYAEEHASYWT